MAPTSTGGVVLPPDPIRQIPTYRAALAAYERLPQVRVLFDNGAGRSPSDTVTPGDPYAGFEQSFSRFPIPGTVPAQSAELDHFSWNATALPATDYASSDMATGGLWGDAADWDWRWQQNPAGTALSYLTAPLTQNTAVIGGGAVHVWLMASAPSVDLQATVSEVRPDGMETFVQDGWARADERRPARGSTLLEPMPDLRRSAVQPLPRGRFAEVTIPLYYEGHVYRAGSRIRVTISAPGGTQPLWAFAAAQPHGATPRVAVGLSPSMPSNLVLPVVPGGSRRRTWRSAMPARSRSRSRSRALRACPD
jgi:hypothetical protein